MPTEEEIEKARKWMLETKNIHPLPESFAKYSNEENKALLEEVKELKKAIEIYEEGYLLLNNQLEQ